MTEPPHDGGQGPSGETPQDPGASDPGSPDYAGSPDEGPRRGAHRASGRPTPPPPPPAGAPYWPAPPDAPPGPKLKQPLADTLPLRLLQSGAAVLALGLVVLLLYVFFHKGDGSEKNNAVTGGTSATHSTPPGRPTVTPTTSATGRTSAPATTTAGQPTSTTGNPTATKTAKPGSKPPTTKPPTTKPTAKPTTAKPTPPTTKPPTTKPPVTTPPPPADVKAPLLVLNNSRIHGLALTGAATFRNGGWTVVGTGNYTGRLPETTVFYSPGSQAAAETLARQFPTVTAVKPRPAGFNGDAPLIVVLTRYFKP